MTAAAYLTNGRIYSMEAETGVYTSMLISGGLVQSLHRQGESPDLPRGCRVIDLEGKTVLPGFTDCHAHFLPSAILHSTGCSVSRVSGGKLTPEAVAAVIEILVRFAGEGRNKKAPVIGFNCIVPSLRERRLPFREELDKALPGRQVVILGMDGHASSYSSPALEALGIDPAGHEGILIGEEHDMHIGRLTDLVMKSLSFRDILTALQEFSFHAAFRGITCVHCLEGSEDKPNNLAIRLLILAARILPIRLKLYLQYKDTEAVRPFVKHLSHPRLGGCQAWEMDGSVGSQTAAFFEAYPGTNDNRGVCYYTTEEILPYVEKAHREGFQLTAHGIGPRGIETLLAAYEQVLKHEPPGTNPHRHRIDHFEFPRVDQVKRAIEDLGLLVTVQPGYTWMDQRYQQAYRQYLSPEQIQSQVPLKRIADLGGIICGSSDTPVQDPDPFLQIQGMVDFPVAEQSLSMYQALRTYTYNGAYSGFEENTRGTLGPGKAADFIILSKDPFTLPKGAVAGTAPEETWIAGKTVVKRLLPAWLFLLKALLSPKKKV
ncbi:MAG: amidohydrolase family protein [Spirochaetales bacterium]|nr:amidohydrolase family protein [Spirochaetales bacterium]